ncbi:hypothetical protein AGLY_003178 [Aphis glycines]|uniref:Uncharacterized protein n=1 Tax=Aphis glycines TaxID=307491 RepID=A0A6G0U2T3_APHGL|nr:hypothetical protein AGLY_003178 [Aphis glycines]
MESLRTIKFFRYMEDSVLNSICYKEDLLYTKKKYILDVVHLEKEAWNKVRAKTNISCFCHRRFKTNDKTGDEHEQKTSQSLEKSLWKLDWCRLKPRYYKSFYKKRDLVGYYKAHDAFFSLKICRNIKLQVFFNGKYNDCTNFVPIECEDSSYKFDSTFSIQNCTLHVIAHFRHRYTYNNLGLNFVKSSIRLCVNSNDDLSSIFRLDIIVCRKHKLKRVYNTKHRGYSTLLPLLHILISTYQVEQNT